jgi:hypothetical protein
MSQDCQASACWRPKPIAAVGLKWEVQPELRLRWLRLPAHRLNFFLYRKFQSRQCVSTKTERIASGAKGIAPRALGTELVRCVDHVPNRSHHAQSRNLSHCKADLTYTMVLDVVKILDTGKGEKSVAEDRGAVLRKIKNWHRASIAGYRISFREARGPEHRIEWDGKEARVWRT